MEPVRWGVLSVSGHYALRIHAPLSRLPEATIAAIASRDEERAKAGAARFGIARSYASYEALLADPKVEAVYMPCPITSMPSGPCAPSTPGSTSCARSP